MSRAIPSNRPLSPDQTEPVQGPAPTRLLPYLRPPVEEDEIGRLGGYRVLRLLAEGGMGKVFLADDIALGRPVALKVLQPHLEQVLPGAFERFLREARAMASIKHDNLVTVYAAGQDGDTVYMAMELLQGETLEQRLNRAAPLPPDEAARVGREVAVGLAAVHERGLIHRDIKPANLWLEAPSGRVKILDFGLVRGTEGDRGLTQAGMVLGTPAYLSPEQVRGEAFDTRADLFSLGCVLYRMCTNQAPFPAATAMAQLTAVVVDEAVPVADLNPAVPPDLADLIMQLIDKAPDRRPASAAEVADRLLRARRGLTGAKKRPRGETAGKSAGKSAGRARRARPSAPARRAAATRRPWWVWATLAAALLVPLVVAGVVALRKPDGKRNEQPQAGQVDGPSKAGPAQAPGRVHLAGLEKAKTANWPFPGPPPPGTDGSAVIRGRSDPNSIFMHAAPPHQGPPSITYRLGQAYARLSGSVAYNDTAPKFPPPPPITFAVYLDGKEVWRSRALARRDDTDSFDLPVSEGDVLRIEMYGPDGPAVHGCHGAWIDPVLTK